MGQKVALPSLVTFDVSCTGDGKSFLGTGMRFHFWHSLSILKRKSMLFILFNQTTVV